MGGGILKNKLDEEDKQSIKISESTKEFREQVLKNTKLNALLNKDFDPNSLSEEQIQHIISSSNLSTEEKEGLQWNKQNLSDNAVLQKEILENLGQSIDEPKTPFQKATNPELNEYYQDDNEEDLNNFDLGDPEFKVDELEELEKSERPRVVEDTNESEDQKRSFAELRKQHYHNEHIHAPEGQKLPQTEGDEQDYEDADEEEEEEDEDEDEEEEEETPRKSFAELRKQHYAHEHPPLGQTFDDDDEEEE